MADRRVPILAEGRFTPIDAKTATCVIRYASDEVIDVMGQVGREMDERYRETARGGLAATPTGKKLAASVRWEGPAFENTNEARARQLEAEESPDG